MLGLSASAGELLACQQARLWLYQPPWRRGDSFARDQGMVRRDRRSGKGRASGRFVESGGAEPYLLPGGMGCVCVMLSAHLSRHHKSSFLLRRPCCWVRQFSILLLGFSACLYKRGETEATSRWKDNAHTSLPASALALWLHSEGAMSPVENQGCWFVVQIPTSDGNRGCLLLATSLHSSPAMSFIQRAMLISFFSLPLLVGSNFCGLGSLAWLL